MGDEYANEDRGISNVVGVVLLVAISITAALLILSAGQSTIEDTRNDQDVEVTVDTFQQADTLFRSFPREVNNTGSRSVSIPESIQEDLESSQETTYRIRLNDNPDCDTGQHQLGSLQYQSDNGRLIGYQGGGVWELNSESSSMRSPPGISYTEGSLNVQFRSVDGNITNSESITVESNKSLERARQNTLMTALYTNLSYDEVSSAPDQHTVCEPSSVWKATVFINESDFAGAWARYAQENYNSSRVKVTPTGSVSAGENVSLTFALGDVSEPEVVVENIETERHSAVGPLWVNTSVRNRGGLETTQTIEFSFGNDTQTISTDSTDVTLVGGRQEQLNFTVPRATLQSSISAGQYNATVETNSESTNETVHFGSSPHVSDFQITSVSAPTDAAVDADRRVEVTVNNTGGLSDRRAVTFQFDGNRVNETTRSLTPGENETVSFTVPTEMDGRHNWNVSTDDDSTNGTIVVGTDARYTIESLTPPSSDTAGNTFTLEATIANEGQRNGTRPVDFRIQNDTNGNVVTDQTFTLSLNGTAVGSTDTTTESISPSINTVGTYNYTVSTGGALQTGSFTVGSQNKPNFIVQSLTFSENPTTFGKQIWFNTTIRNTGDAAGTQTVNLSSNGKLWESQRTLVSGGSETITKNRSVTSANFSTGDNTVEVRTANASLSKTLNVSTVNPGDSVDQDGNQLTTTVGVNASIELLGAELEGEYTEDCSPNDQPCPASYSELGWAGLTYERRAIINDPTEMALEVDNDTGDYRIPLWQGKYGGDLNHPKAEFDLINGPNPYNETYTFGPNVSFGVYATSYTCNDYDDTTVVWRDLVDASSGLRDAIGKECTNRGGVRIPIDSSDNPSNVVILKDGESIPGPTNTFQADFYQRNVQEILGSRLHSNKTLDLAPGERVMMYELSENNAYPSQAN
jgi:flagellin-like protein